MQFPVKPGFCIFGANWHRRELTKRFMCLDDVRSTYDQTLAWRIGMFAEHAVHLPFIEIPHPAIAGAMLFICSWG